MLNLKCSRANTQDKIWGLKGGEIGLENCNPKTSKPTTEKTSPQSFLWKQDPSEKGKSLWKSATDKCGRKEKGLGLTCVPQSSPLQGGLWN